MPGVQPRAQLLGQSERVYVKGVAFDLTPAQDGLIFVARSGKRLTGHLKQDSDGRFRVSFIAGRSFPTRHKAIWHLAYWHTLDRYKQPLRFKEIQWPDGTVSQVVRGESDNALQLTIWQIEIAVEQARDAIAKLPARGHGTRGKERVYKAEVGLKLHRALELMLKVLLGRGVENDTWRFYGENRTHDLMLLYDKLETQDSDAASQLDDVFQQLVMVHGNPTFGTFVMMNESITSGARCFRDHLELMGVNSAYSQAYLGDAVQRIDSAYLKYLANAGPYLDFVDEAMRQVVMPSVGHLLPGQ